MTRAIRRFALAAGAAALLSTQAAYAAPTAVRTVDPLVSLSVLGTAQSRAAVCAAGAGAAAAGAAVAAVQGAPAGCLLPLTDTPPPVVPQAAAPPPPLPAPGKRIGVLPILLGVLAIAALAFLILDDDDDSDGDLIPISPA